MHEDQVSTSLDPMERERQTYRAGMATLTAIYSLIQCGVLALFAASGMIPYWIAAAFLAAGVGSSLIFLAIFKSGANLRWQRKDMMAQQCLTVLLIQFAFIFIAPKLTVFFLLVTLVVCAYGLMQCSLLQFAAGWLAFGVVSGAVLWLVRDQVVSVGAPEAEVVLVWLFFFFALGLFVFARKQYSRQRGKLSANREQLRAALAKIEALSTSDLLTGALNRRALIAALESELLRAHRTGHPFCFAIIDLDHFRVVNERHGSEIGDIVLKTVSDTAMKLLRALDRFGRIGGEEFGILLPATWLDQGVIAMGRLAKAVGACEWVYIAPDLNVTFSAGITTNAVNDTAAIIIKRAEEALFKAKLEGRNRIVQAEEALPEMPGMDLD